MALLSHLLPCVFTDEICEKKNFKTLVEVFWRSTFSSDDLAKLVYDFAAEQVSEEKATGESDRGGVKKRRTSRQQFYRLVQGLASEKTANFGKQQCRLSGWEMSK